MFSLVARCHGAVRVAEEDVDIGVHRDLVPLAHLRTLIPGQRRAQHFRQSFDLRRQGVPHQLGGIAVGQVQQHRVVGGALHQGADRGQVLAADDQVALRKTVHGPGGPGVAEVALRCGR